jgi:hypothetical protein
MTQDFPEEPVQLKRRYREVVSVLSVLKIVVQAKEDMVKFGARTASC